MFTRRTFTGLVALGAAGVQSASARAQSSGRRAEILALRRFAETTHPRGREAAEDADWCARWNALAADADGLSDGLYVLRARRALGWFKDGHTIASDFVEGVQGLLSAGPLRLSLPMLVRVFHDGAYVTDAKDEALPLLGARLTHIGTLEPTTFIRAITEQWPGSDAWAHRWAGAQLSLPAIIQAFGGAENAEAAIRVEGVHGHRRPSAMLRPRVHASAALNAIERTPTEQERWRIAAGAGNYVRMLHAERTLYVSIDDMLDLESKSFEAFTQECFVAMDGEVADRLIVDLRRNGGGNNFLPEPLRKRIQRSRFNRPGHLYVLISPVAFSAAQNMVTRIERETFALFVGEPTGGSPNHYGDAQTFTGEASGMLAYVSSRAWFDSYPPDPRIWTMPDLPAPEVFADWRAGRDPALSLALSHQTNALADDLSPEHIFFFARRSQLTEWRPFWRNV